MSFCSNRKVWHLPKTQRSPPKLNRTHTKQVLRACGMNYDRTWHQVGEGFNQQTTSIWSIIHLSIALKAEKILSPNCICFEEHAIFSIIFDRFVMFLAPTLLQSSLFLQLGFSFHPVFMGWSLSSRRSEMSKPNSSFGGKESSWESDRRWLLRWRDW